MGNISSKYDVLIIGGGASGFFAALSVKEHYPKYSVAIVEKTSKVLGKVKVSGGGRCNVTHHCFDVKKLCSNYPRGEKEIRPIFKQFAVEDTINWFEKRGIELKTEEDGRMFPVTNNSQTIIDCLMRETQQLGIEILLQTNIGTIVPNKNGFVLETANEQLSTKYLIVATGGSPKLNGLQWLKELNHEIEPPVPSLFTFNIPQNTITQLMGVSVPQAKVRIIGTKLSYTGALLITHWGMSGPVVLKLSAWGAKWLNKQNYKCILSINWHEAKNEEEVRNYLTEFRKTNRLKLIVNARPCDLPKRLWAYFLNQLNISPNTQWANLKKQDFNRLINTLYNDEYTVSGKTTFKDEFVTAGGVSLKSVDMATLQSKTVPHLYFAGEVLDIDGITGGFNFQAAWSGSWVAGKLG